MHYVEVSLTVHHILTGMPNNPNEAHGKAIVALCIQDASDIVPGC